MKSLMPHLKLLACALLLALSGPVLGQNSGGTLLPSLARTGATTVSADQTNVTGNAVHVITDCSVFVSGTFTVTIQGKDPASGKYYTLLTGAAIAGTGAQVLKVGRGLPATANVSANDILPTVWRVSVAGASTPSATFSVGFMVVE